VLTNLIEREELLRVSFGLIVSGNDFFVHPTLKLFVAAIRWKLHEERVDGFVGRSVVSLFDTASKKLE